MVKLKTINSGTLLPNEVMVVGRSQMETDVLLIIQIAFLSLQLYI